MFSKQEQEYLQDPKMFREQFNSGYARQIKYRIRNKLKTAIKEFHHLLELDKEEISKFEGYLFEDHIPLRELFGFIYELAKNSGLYCRTMLKEIADKDWDNEESFKDLWYRVLDTIEKPSTNDLFVESIMARGSSKGKYVR